MSKKENIKKIRELAEELGLTREDIDGAVSQKACYILLDRTGSMGPKWEETINSLNTYLRDLQGGVKVYVTTFDSQSYDVLRTGTTPVVPVLTSEVAPRAWTNLYDSLVRVMDKMLEDDIGRSVFVLITDGLENSSTEYKMNDVKTRLAKLKSKEWPVVFLGANFDQIEECGTSFGLSSKQTVNFGIGKFNLGAMRSSTKTNVYYDTGATAAMNWTDQEKQEVK